MDLKVYIDIWPESGSFSSSLGSSSSSRSRVPSSSLSKSPSLNTPRHMRDLDPTVTFVSPSVVIGKSSYIIVLDGAPIHSEDTELECIGPYSSSSVIPPGGSPLLYSTALVPKYWDILCKSPDPTMYTIIQDVYRRDPAPLGRFSGRPRSVLIFSAKYHFRYSVPANTPSSPMTPYTAYHPNPPFHANVNRAHPNLLEPNFPRNHPSMPPNLLGQDSSQSHEDSTQSQLYMQATSGVSIGNYSSVNNHESYATTSKEMMARSSFSSFPKDIRNYIV
ncbi:hypothetical protein EDD22DRAFT_924632 [Suillus occidentalis]|nr:hypothetical protein EDD22DRAFT_924632 [Suillus occidentalis]